MCLLYYFFDLLVLYALGGLFFVVSWTESFFLEPEKIGLSLSNIGANVVKDSLWKSSGVGEDVLGVVAPLLDDGLLDPAGVLLGVHAHLLGHLDAVGLLDESVERRKEKS